MGVQLNIKSAEARALAEQVARATGETITEAVTRSLRKRLREIEHDQATTEDHVAQRKADFYHLISGSRGRWRDTMLSIDHGDMLYDERGLPR